ncbi:MAG: 50S ribosomal protein L18 [Halobacteria archaeon]
MATGAKYNVPFKRRREGRTDYQQRLALLKSGKPRLVVRKSNRNTTVQLVLAGEEGDVTEACGNTSHLEEYGWEGPTGNIPAAYLAGFLAGLDATAEGYEEAVLDIGLNHVTPGNKVFAALKGALDAGMEVPHGEDVLPEWSRVRGEDIAEYAEYSAREIDAEEIPEHFDEVLEELEENHE